MGAKNAAYILSVIAFIFSAGMYFIVTYYKMNINPFSLLILGVNSFVWLCNLIGQGKPVRKILYLKYGYGYITVISYVILFVIYIFFVVACAFQPNFPNFTVPKLAFFLGILSMVSAGWQVIQLFIKDDEFTKTNPKAFNANEAKTRETE